MIELNPNALYSREELDSLLRDHGISLPAFLDGLDVQPRFRHCVMGAEILAGIARATGPGAAPARPAAPPAAVLEVPGKRGPGRPPKRTGLEPLTREQCGLTAEGRK